MPKYFKKIIHFALPYKKYAFLNIFFNMLYALFSALSFVAIIPMLTVLFSEGKKVYEKPIYKGIFHIKEYCESHMSYFITYFSEQNGKNQTLMVMVAIIIGIFLLKNIFNYAAMFYISFLRNGMVKDIRNSMYKKILELPLSFYSEKRKGDIISRITSDVMEVQWSFLSILELIVREPLTILFTIIAMFVISVKLTVFVFIFIPISGFLISRLGKSLSKNSLTASKEQGLFISIIEESLAGLKIIKGFNSESRFRTKFEISTEKFFRLNNKIMNRQNLASPLSEFLGITTIAILLIYGGNMVLVEESLTAAGFIAYIGLAYNILTPAKEISKASYGVKKGDASAMRISEIMEQENSIKDCKNPVDKNTFEKDIVVSDLNFKYEDKIVLKNFNLQIEKGKTVALVGQSGSGKSTIANLMTRLWDIEDGKIQIDGIDIKDFKLQNLRELFAIVTQDSILFNDTIKNNLLLGKADATDQEIMEALKTANAHDFVMDLPQGIDTNIGDSGSKLSGGQKQRISIARAVLKNAPIMILDEATSALDTQSEKLVQEAIDNMMQNKTSIVIAHRLSTIQNADNIVVIHEGEIIESGTHADLLSKAGTYSKLVSLQSFD